MRRTFSYRARTPQYSTVAEHFSQLNIHPGYLAEIEPKPSLSKKSVTAHRTTPPILRASSNSVIDYVSFAAAFVGLTIALSTAFLYYTRLASKSLPQVPVQATNQDPNIPRLEESVRRLGVAMTTVVAKLQENQSRLTSEQSKIVEVVVPKANLRIAPNTSSSAVMAISRGSRLLVELEQGEWLRVFAPTGESVWIQRALTSAYQQ